MGGVYSKPMIYVASPYSHPDPFVVDKRFQAVEQFTARLIGAGMLAYSPIAAFHHMARRYSLPKDAIYWRAHNQHTMSHASELFVLRLPGWEESRGVQMEIDWADRMGLPVSYHDSDFMAEFAEA